MNDFNGTKIKEGDKLTFDWFGGEDVINKMRRLFPKNFADATDQEIQERVHKPCYIAKINDKGRWYGEGIEVKENGRRLYAHDFRLKYTKIVSED